MQGDGNLPHKVLPHTVVQDLAGVDLRRADEVK
jgi:hypothetical protein